MAENTKGSSPFYPGQPIPVNLFTGRIQPLKRIMTRGVAQVAAGKPVTMFVRGEYGIGKSSLANYARAIAETRNETNLHGVYVTLALPAVFKMSAVRSWKGSSIQAPSSQSGLKRSENGSPDISANSHYLASTSTKKLSRTMRFGSPGPKDCLPS